MVKENQLVVSNGVIKRYHNNKSIYSFYIDFFNKSRWYLYSMDSTWQL